MRTRAASFLPFILAALFSACGGPKEPTPLEKALMELNARESVMWSDLMMADAYQGDEALRAQKHYDLANLSGDLTWDGEPGSDAGTLVGPDGPVALQRSPSSKTTSGIWSVSDQ